MARKAKRQPAQNPPKRRITARGCLYSIIGFIGLCFMATVAGTIPTNQSRELTRTADVQTVQAVAQAQRATPTPLPTVNPRVALAAAQARVTPTPRTASADGLFAIESDGVLLMVSRVEFVNTIDGSAASNGVLAVFTGEFQTPRRACIVARDIRLILDGEEYAPERGWMHAYQGTLDESIDYPGPLGGQCVDANVPTPTFFVFDVPLRADEVLLRFKESVVQLEMAWGEFVAAAATNTPPTAIVRLMTNTARPLASPTRTPRATNTRQPSNTPPPSFPTALPPTRIGENMRGINGDIIQEYEALGFGVRLVTVIEDSVYAEVDVPPGENTPETAELLRDTALDRIDRQITEFGVILNDGRSVPVSYTWTARRGWDETEMRANGIVPVTPLAPRTNPTITAAPRTNSTPSADVEQMPDTTFYVLGSANVRSCPSTSCDALGTLGSGAPVIVNGRVEDGEAFTGNNSLWYRIQYNNRTAYIYSGVVSSNPPVAGGGGGFNSSATSPAATPILMSTPTTSATVWDCSGNIYNCSDFQGRRDELMDYWNACPGDPSRLDGNPVDGVPCNSMWN